MLGRYRMSETWYAAGKWRTARRFQKKMPRPIKPRHFSLVTRIQACAKMFWAVAINYLLRAQYLRTRRWRFLNLYVYSAPLPAPTAVPMAAPFPPPAIAPTPAPVAAVPATVNLSRCFCQKLRLWRRYRTVVLVCAEAVGTIGWNEIAKLLIRKRLKRVIVRTLFILSSVLFHSEFSENSRRFAIHALNGHSACQKSYRQPTGAILSIPNNWSAGSRLWRRKLQ